jgi:hypothetical protein
MFIVNIVFILYNAFYTKKQELFDSNVSESTEKKSSIQLYSKKTKTLCKYSEIITRILCEILGDKKISTQKTFENRLEKNIREESNTIFLQCYTFVYFVLKQCALLKDEDDIDTMIYIFSTLITILNAVAQSMRDYTKKKESFIEFYTVPENSTEDECYIRNILKLSSINSIESNKTNYKKVTESYEHFLCSVDEEGELVGPKQVLLEKTKVSMLNLFTNSINLIYYMTINL